MNKGKNKYEKKKDRKTFKERMQNPKTHLREAGKGLLRDLVVGVVAGGATGAIVGRPSLVIGLVVNATGHFMEMPGISSFGMGMMAANGFQGESATVSGTETSAMERAKQRLLNYKNNFTQKIYLDKIMKKKEEKTQTAEDQPVGEVKYFVYPHSQNADMNQMDLTALDNIENQVVMSAENFQKKESLSTSEREVSGNDQTLMMSDPLY
ncbi:MAG: hypothetical protein ACOZCO_15765 [Bacteroidota bacterium]